MFPAYTSFAGAYTRGLGRVLDEGEKVPGVADSTSVGSSFGGQKRPTYELRPFGFTVSNPRQALLRCPTRQPDLGFALGQWLWVMSGSDELDPIAYYNSMGRLFSDDGRRLRGAFGPKVGKGHLDAAIDLLQRDPATRRAIIFLADSTGPGTRSRDHSCAISLQFLIRKEKLEAITSMRSQSALMVLPYDAALFLTIQVWTAALLDLDVGSHTWVANSFHLYEDEVALAREVLDEPVSSVSLPPITDPHGSLPALLRFEHQLRRATERGDVHEAAELERGATVAEDFEGAIRALLLAHAGRKLQHAQIWRSALAKLPPGWDECLRKPESMLAPTR